VAPQRKGRLLPRYTDGFNGTSLSPRWSWVRQPDDPTSYGVEGGRFRFDTQYADLHVDSNNASVLVEQAPKGDYVVQTKVGLDLLDDGCCHNFAQAGVVIYGSDDAFLKLVHASLWETRQTEWATEEPTVPHWPGAATGNDENRRYGNTVVGPPGDDTWLRIVKDGDSYTAYTSDDGEHWVRGGVWVNHTVGERPRIGLVSMGCVHLSDDGLGCAAPFHATFDNVRVWRLRH
jgi:arabinan endo-1,5-alpha-L-arabinosidase